MGPIKLDRRSLLTVLGSVAVGGAARAAAPARPAARSAYERAIVINGQGSVSDPDPNAKPDDPPSKRMFDEVRASGVTAISTTVGEVGNGPDRYLHALDYLALYSSLAANSPDLFMTILRGSDLALAKRNGRLGLIYNLQDTTALETDLSRVRALRQAGVRVIQLTYNKRNLCGDGALEAANSGLSDFGHEVIAELEKNKVQLDLSHGGQKTIAEAIAAAKVPPTISHTGCRDLVDNPRNVYDRELRALADKGGVVGIYFMPFLRNGGMATSEDVIRHLEHAVKVCGEDHVGIGTDGKLSALVMDDKARERQRKFYETRKAQGLAAPGEAADVFNIVVDYNSHRRFENLANDLSRRGWPWSRIEKILGSNFARVFTQAWGG
ncbi:dipeptidase [Hyalangium rubrum]|uniref:Membrane dipeptidase n=1 Tax=Hyalangium rubrum TaxID=3103134 RepID=A0ABU5HAM1_9BACT|nr:membrane dipeptidase [Hyalangium sp. s54d21]MDY7230355.1 membrane dipeptidase [Hyalangium sp. s54d21]